MVDLKEIEYIMDRANGEFGTKESYCLFCNSKEYNSKVGIIHKEQCIILRLRKAINI